MAESVTVIMSLLGVGATLFGIYTGFRTLQQSKRRIRVRLEAMTETIAIVVLNPGEKDVPLSGVRLLTSTNAALPLDALTEGHFPLALGPGTSYKLPMRKDALIQVLERNGIGPDVKVRAEAVEGTGKGRRSGYVLIA